MGKDAKTKAIRKSIRRRENPAKVFELFRDGGEGEIAREFRRHEMFCLNLPHIKYANGGQKGPTRVSRYNWQYESRMKNSRGPAIMRQGRDVYGKKTVPPVLGEIVR